MTVLPLSSPARGNSARRNWGSNTQPFSYKTTALPPELSRLDVLTFMTTKKKWKCYPLCFFSRRPIKNNSVTPYVSLMITNKKQQFYTHVLFSWTPIKNNSVTPYVFIFMTSDKKQQCYPLCFIFKTTVLPLVLFSWPPIQNDSFMNDKKQQCFIFMTSDKKQQCYPLCFIFMTADKKQQCYPLFYFHDLW